MEEKTFHVSRLLKSFKNAFKGLYHFVRHEHNARIHVLAAVLTLIFGWALRIEPWEWCLIIVLIGGVLSLEAMNTALEKLTDQVHPERSDEIAKLKDVAASAVLIFSSAALTVGMIIFLPKIISLFH